MQDPVNPDTTVTSPVVPIDSTETPTTPTVDIAPVETTAALPFGGFADGEVLPTGEVIKGSYDADGKLIGWHKELPIVGGAE